MLKTDKRLFLLLFSAVLMLLVLFTFLDLPFSQAIYKGETSAFAHLFEVWGELPAYLVVFTAGNIVLRSRTLHEGSSKLGILLAGGLITAIGGIGGGIISLSRMEGAKTIGVIVAIILTILLSYLLQLWLNKFDDNTIRNFRTVAWAGLLIILAEIMITNLVKIAWGRMRYREMLDDVSQFTPWYEIRGFQDNSESSDAYKSFPSWHSANAWAALVFVLFAPYQRTWRLWCLSAAIAWGLCTSYSRVIYGAHFATDVLAGAMITLLSFYMISKWFKLSIIETLN